MKMRVSSGLLLTLVLISMPTLLHGYSNQCAQELVSCPTINPNANGNLSWPAKDEYQSGYNHGIKDAKTEKLNPTSHSLYIVQPGNNLPDHTQNFTWGYIDGYCSLQICKSVNKSSTLDPSSFNAGLLYGFNDWNQNTDNKNYSCPLSQPYWHSNFCNGYDAALTYENSDY